jgi:hypothetical protein
MNRRMMPLGKKVAAVLAALLLVTAACWGAVYSAVVIDYIDGVDAAGNPSFVNGSYAAGKSFKDLSTGIIYQVLEATVTNDYGAARTFHNRGLTVVDPENRSVKHTATTDATFIAKPRRKFQSNAVQICVYDPNY